MNNKMSRFSVSENEFQNVVEIIRSLLNQRDEISFAYLHGSFLKKTNFGDIDIALYLTNVPETAFLQYELNLEQALEAAIKIPVDIRVINIAPPSFRYSAIKNGLRLKDRDEDARVEFETTTFSHYFDFLPYRQRYLKEVLKNEI